MTRVDRRITVLSAAIYFAEYIGRYNLAAAMSEMTGTFTAGNAKTMLGLALTLMAISYGVGQIVMGFVGDRVPPRFVVFAGLLGAGACNLAVGFSTNLVVICVAWFFNGVCKSMIWPSLIRQMTCDMSEAGFHRGILWVSVASNLGIVLVYLAVVPVSILIFSWRLAFWFAGAVEAAAGVAWVLSVRTIPSAGLLKRALRDGAKDPDGTDEKSEKRFKLFPVLFAASIPLLYLVVICHGLLRDGLTSWMPTLLRDTYRLDSVAAIMSSAILPIFSTVCVIFSGMLFLKLKNEMTSSAIFWAITLASLGGLSFAIGRSAILTIILLAFAMSGIQGVNHILTTRVPHRFAYAGMVSTIAGLLNSATYIGAAISGYGIALFSDAHGWYATVLAWLAVAVLGTVALVFCFAKWKKFTSEHK
ncbi:MAG: MFS transporter [Clostridia bacterium]|nr:MFS transporter [Clostridia bacterium]